MVGQEVAKKVLSVAVYNHYKRLSVNLPAQAEGNISENNSVSFQDERARSRTKGKYISTFFVTKFLSYRLIKLSFFKSING